MPIAICYLLIWVSVFSLSAHCSSVSFYMHLQIYELHREAMSKFYLHHRNRALFLLCEMSHRTYISSLSLTLSFLSSLSLLTFQVIRNAPAHISDEMQQSFHITLSQYLTVPFLRRSQTHRAKTLDVQHYYRMILLYLILNSEL